VQRRQLMTGTAAGVVGLVTTTAAAGPARAADAGPSNVWDGMVRLDRLRLVSLSHVNDPASTPIFPGDPPFTMTTAATVEQDGYYLQDVHEGEHTGTHWGCPRHFHVDERAADQLEPNDLLLPAVRIDIRRQSAHNADYGLTVADLVAWESHHGRIPDGSAVVLWTGWGERWGTPAYANTGADGLTHQPGFTLESVQWLVDTGRLGVRGALGSDTFGPDRGVDDTFAVSSLLYHHRRISLENMANLQLLPDAGGYILVGGVINRHGSGSPATIYGILPD